MPAPPTRVGARGHYGLVSFDAAKYAHPERERRFLLAGVPGEATDQREIVDHYVIGSRMRLRSVTSATDGTVYKLGHKVRPDPDDPGFVMHTSFYLSHEEYDLLAALPAHELRKTRFRVDRPDGAMSVDAFHGVLEGLVLAEVDLALPGAPEGSFEPPAFCVTEVSDDERFTGGRLAGADAAAARLLVELGRRPPPGGPD
jgi:CYTH domain-containing protein